MPQKMTFEFIIVYITLKPTNSSAGKWYWWIQLFVYIFGAKFKMASRDPKRVTSQVFWSFLLPKIVFSSLQFIKVKIEGVWNCLMIFFTFVTINQQTAGLEKNYYSLEWPPYQDKRVDRPNISVSWTGMKLGPKMYFVNKQLTYFIKNLRTHQFFTKFSIIWVKWTFSESFIKIQSSEFGENGVSLFQWLIY